MANLTFPYKSILLSVFFSKYLFYSSLLHPINSQLRSIISSSPPGSKYNSLSFCVTVGRFFCRPPAHEAKKPHFREQAAVQIRPYP